MDIVLQVGVKALLKNNKGKYLLLRRSEIKYPNMDGRWDIVGGRINAGTPLLKNLQREIKEETGLTLKKKPTLIAAQDILRGDGRHIVRLTYLAEISGKPVIDPEEHNHHGWFTLEEINQMEDLNYYFKLILESLDSKIRD